MRIGDRYQSLMDKSSNVGAARSGGNAVAVGDAKGDRSGSAQGAGSAVEVKVSDKAAQLADGAQKLEHLKAQIKNGSFKVDAQAIANRIAGGDDE